MPISNEKIPSAVDNGQVGGYWIELNRTMDPGETGLDVSASRSCLCCGHQASVLREISVTQEMFLRNVHESCGYPGSMDTSFTDLCSMCRKIGRNEMNQQEPDNRTKKSKVFKRNRQELYKSEALHEASREVCRASQRSTRPFTATLAPRAFVRFVAKQPSTIRPWIKL